MASSPTFFGVPRCAKYAGLPHTTRRDRTNPGGDEATVGQFTNSDREIDMVFQEIDQAIG
jgi:hypothetical protein